MWVSRIDGGPRKVNHAAVVIDDKIYCFGGYCSGEDFDVNRPMEVCVLDTETLRWRALAPPAGFSEDANISDVPFHRYGHSAVVWKRVVYVWGGRNDSSGACNTLYAYDVDTAVWNRPRVHGLLPERRDGHAAALLADTMFIFGGFEEIGDRFSCDLFAFHIPSLTWSHIVPKADLPMPRDFATMEPHGDYLLLWGGRGDMDPDGIHTGHEIYENCLNIFNVNTRTWLTIPTLSAPPARRSHASFVYNGKMYIFGGFNGKDHYADLWAFDPTTLNWSEISFSTSPFVPNVRRRMACCICGDRLFMFGGTSPQLLPTISNDSGLYDHDDLFVMEFLPKLTTLARNAVLRYNLPTDHLSANIKLDFLINTLPNTIGKQQKIRLGNHSG